MSLSPETTSVIGNIREDFLNLAIGSEALRERIEEVLSRLQSEASFTRLKLDVQQLPTDYHRRAYFDALLACACLEGNLKVLSFVEEYKRCSPCGVLYGIRLAAAQGQKEPLERLLEQGVRFVDPSLQASQETTSPTLSPQDCYRSAFEAALFHENQRSLQFLVQQFHTSPLLQQNSLLSATLYGYYAAAREFRKPVSFLAASVSEIEKKESFFPPSLRWLEDLNESLKAFCYRPVIEKKLYKLTGAQLFKSAQTLRRDTADLLLRSVRTAEEATGLRSFLLLGAAYYGSTELGTYLLRRALIKEEMLEAAVRLSAGRGHKELLNRFLTRASSNEVLHKWWENAFSEALYHRQHALAEELYDQLPTPKPLLSQSTIVSSVLSESATVLKKILCHQTISDTHVLELLLSHAMYLKIELPKKLSLLELIIKNNSSTLKRGNSEPLLIAVEMGVPDGLDIAELLLDYGMNPFKGNPSPFSFAWDKGAHQFFQLFSKIPVNEDKIER